MLESMIVPDMCSGTSCVIQQSVETKGHRSRWEWPLKEPTMWLYIISTVPFLVAMELIH